MVGSYLFLQKGIYQKQYFRYRFSVCYLLRDIFFYFILFEHVLAAACLIVNARKCTVLIVYLSNYLLICDLDSYVSKEPWYTSITILWDIK